MVLDPSFIADHLKIARKGRLIQGSRVILTEEKTQDILDEGDLPALSMFSSGIEKRLSGSALPLFVQIGRPKRQPQTQRHQNLQYGLFRSDALAVNGFDNSFVGWAGKTAICRPLLS